MSLCILGLGKVLTLSATIFSLSWTHSVERAHWQEHWRISEAGFEIIEAGVKGSGAGMEPSEGAVLKDGWWRFRPKLPMQRELVLAASGATGKGWTLCAGRDCRKLGAVASDPIVLRACNGTP